MTDTASTREVTSEHWRLALVDFLEPSPSERENSNFNRQLDAMSRALMDTTHKLILKAVGAKLHKAVMVEVLYHRFPKENESQMHARAKMDDTLWVNLAEEMQESIRKATNNGVTPFDPLGAPSSIANAVMMLFGAVACFISPQRSVDRMMEALSKLPMDGFLSRKDILQIYYNFEHIEGKAGDAPPPSEADKSGEEGGSPTSDEDAAKKPRGDAKVEGEVGAGTVVFRLRKTQYNTLMKEARIVADNEKEAIRKAFNKLWADEFKHLEIKVKREGSEWMAEVWNKNEEVSKKKPIAFLSEVDEDSAIYAAQYEIFQREGRKIREAQANERGGVGVAGRPAIKKAMVPRTQNETLRELYKKMKTELRLRGQLHVKRPGIIGEDGFVLMRACLDHIKDTYKIQGFDASTYDSVTSLKNTLEEHNVMKRFAFRGEEDDTEIRANYLHKSNEAFAFTQLHQKRQHYRDFTLEDCAQHPYAFTTAAKKEVEELHNNQKLKVPLYDCKPFFLEPIWKGMQEYGKKPEEHRVDHDFSEVYLRWDLRALVEMDKYELKIGAEVYTEDVLLMVAAEKHPHSMPEIPASCVCLLDISAGEWKPFDVSQPLPDFARREVPFGMGLDGTTPVAETTSVARQEEPT